MLLFVIIHVLAGTFVRLSVFLSFIIFFLFFRCVLLYFCTTCPCVPLFLCFQSLSVLSLCFLSLSFSISPCLCLSVSAFSLYPSVCLPFCLIFQSLSLLLLPFCLILQSLSLRVSDVLSYISVSIPQCHWLSVSSFSVYSSLSLTFCLIFQSLSLNVTDFLSHLSVSIPYFFLPIIQFFIELIANIYIQLFTG